MNVQIVRSEIVRIARQTGREVRVRFANGYPMRVVLAGIVGPTVAAIRGYEWVGALGGLTWTRQNGWE